jgi:SSS family solute:Na+ symporter
LEEDNIKRCDCRYSWWSLLAILFDRFLPGIAGSDTLLYTAYPNASGVYEIPFLVQMGWVFFFTFCLIVTVSLLDKKGREHVHALVVDRTMYKVSGAHWVMITIVLLLIVTIYIRFW